MNSTKNKREKILAAAENLLTERRIHELTMDEVAQVACVGKGTIYNHFKNKDDLLFQVATQGFEELCQLVLSTPEKESFRDKLVVMCEHVAEFFRNRRTVMRMIQEHEGRFDSLQVSMKERWLVLRRELVDAVATIMQQGTSQGFFRDDFTAELLATMLLGLMRARGRDYNHIPERRPPVTTIVDIFLNGVTSPDNN